MNKQEAMETILSCKSYVMGNGVLAEFIPFKIAEDIIEKLNTPEVQKVVIHKYISEWIGYCKANGLTLLGAIEPISKFGEGLGNLGKRWSDGKSYLYPLPQG